MRRKIRVGILGCGAIGSELAQIIVRKFYSTCQLTCLNDLNEHKARALAKFLKVRFHLVSTDEMIRRCDFVVEAASPKVVGPLVRKVLSRGKSLLVMSVGGLLSAGVLAQMRKRRRGRGTLFLPSGAVAGIDGLLAARMSRIRKVLLTTKKPPRAFLGAPFLKRREIDLEKIKKETLLFKGSAREAIQLFPQNINVAALLSLAGVGPDKTKVKIYASPFLRRNVHQVEIEGDFGRIVTVTENVPSSRNPKTSFLAALSPAALLEKILGTLRIGT